MNPLRIEPHQRRFAALVGVGGIGSGSFFALSGNHTLGREESRGGRFLDRRDYCKLHIIAHYTKALLGPEFAVFPIGRVGDDAPGRALRAEMEQAGLDLRYVQTAPGEQTLFSFCFVYPDGSGGNLTTDDSACGRVTAATVAAAEPEFARYAGQGIALAVPEVPLAARAALLDYGTRYRFLRVASFTVEEMPAVLASGLLAQVDLLAINRDEAAALAGTSASEEPLQATITAAVTRATGVQPGLRLSITAGASGSWGWDGQSLTHVPAFPAAVQSTAGAGDAHLSGILAGLTAGLPAAECQQLGALVAALAVTSPHTIHPGIDRPALAAFAAASSVRLSEAVRHLLAQ